MSKGVYPKNPGGFRLGFLGETHSFFYHMATKTAPNPARGEATLTIGGEKYTVRFGLKTLRALTQLTGVGPAAFGELLSTNYPEALTGIVAAAVRSHTDQTEFSQDDAADLIDGLSQAEAEGLAEAITEAVSIPPLMAALSAKVAAKNEALGLAPSENGSSTSTSLAS